MVITWKAIYSNGEELLSLNPDGSISEYTDIDRSRLVKFVLLKDGIPVIVIHLGGNKRLIYRIRSEVNPDGLQGRVHLAGWQENVGGKNVQAISFLFDDGHIEFTDGFRDDIKWFKAPNFLK